MSCYSPVDVRLRQISKGVFLVHFQKEWDHFHLLTHSLPLCQPKKKKKKKITCNSKFNIKSSEPHRSKAERMRQRFFEIQHVCMCRKMQTHWSNEGWHQYLLLSLKSPVFKIVLKAMKNQHQHFLKTKSTHYAERPILESFRHNYCMCISFRVTNQNL